ncbi:MAG: hypothetical protein KatS3mg102_2717 [Planctomycetota bacterium]|nr:MAG: hypothetical protein KatS3mg102_2717 [Planctomycetota bacterium]
MIRHCDSSWPRRTRGVWRATGLEPALETALRVYREAIGGRRDFAEPKARLGELLLEAGRTAQALAVLQAARWRPIPASRATGCCWRGRWRARGSSP